MARKRFDARMLRHVRSQLNFHPKSLLTHVTFEWQLSRVHFPDVLQTIGIRIKSFATIVASEPLPVRMPLHMTAQALLGCKFFMTNIAFQLLRFAVHRLNVLFQCDIILKEFTALRAFSRSLRLMRCQVHFQCTRGIPPTRAYAANVRTIIRMSAHMQIQR